MKFEQHLFQRYWHLVCHRTELPNDGDFMKFKTPIGDVVIFNDGGEYVAFDNRCPHRGALIYLTEFGNQPTTCKYHGWTFKSGKLIIPKVDQFNGCNIERANLMKYKIDWCGDFIFISSEPATDLYTQLDGVAEHIENISFNINGRLDLSSYEYECAWTLALENALEPYHIDMVHQNTLATLKLESGTNNFFGINSVWKAQVGNQRVKNQLNKLRAFFNIDYGHEGYMSIFMFPFTMISSTFGYSYSIQNFFPNKNRNDRTNFMSRLLTCNVRDERSKNIVQPFLESCARVNRKVFEEDHAICKNIPHDAWSPEPLKFISEQEIKISHFRETCRTQILSIYSN